MTEKIKIEMVQRRAARILVRNYNRMASAGVLLHQLGWNSLQSRRKAMRLCMLYKLHHGLVAADGMPQLIGSFSNDDGDGNENVTENISSRYVYYFAIIPIRLTCRMWAKPPGTKLIGTTFK